MNLLLTGAFTYSQAQLEALRALGADITFVQDERDELSMDVSRFDAVVCNGLFLQNDITRFQSLRFIQTTSVGLDRMPLDYINAQGIQICNARGVYSVPMAEWALCGVLSLYKHIAAFLDRQANALWEKDRTVRELSGDTVLVVGCGSAGTECAKRFKAFGTRVVAADICRPAEVCYDAYYSMDALPSALEIADVIVLTLPLTKETRGMFCRTLFSKCKRGAILVNIARGAVVYEKDLIEALKNGTLGGAVLDVFETEPLPKESPLWGMENVILTPHNSFVSPQNNERLFDVIYKNLEAYVKKRSDR
ncbi:MAG: D-2-hydroxyacid dehydrogenase [Candidatus Fimenecus sp.]